MIAPNVIKEIEKGVQEFDPVYLYQEDNLSRVYGRAGTHFVMLAQFNKTIIARHGGFLFMFSYESHDDFNQPYEWLAKYILAAGNDVQDPMVTPVFIWVVKLIRKAIISGWL